VALSISKHGAGIEGQLHSQNSIYDRLKPHFALTNNLYYE
jgi:hypothetical protein